MRRQAVLLSALCLALATTPAAAQSAKPKPNATPGFSPFAASSSKEPIAIEADRLEVFDKEQRAVYTGNVVVRQGDTTMKSANMIVFYDRAPQPGGQARPAEGEGQAALRKVEARGGVSVSSKTQVATGNEGVYDRAQNRIILTGNVALSDGPNITTGERLVYDLTKGVAVIERGATTRVKGMFVPADADKTANTAKPAKQN
jgi:lipopolysaccharide export system protein LptA